MRHYFLLILLLILLPGAQKEKPEIPSGLMVEFIRDPSIVKIMDLIPEFTWIVPSEAVSQAAFQIMVSSSLDKSRNNIADVWDSGKKESNQSVEVEYGGEMMQPNNTYFWKVRIWDSKNRLSSWSVIQSFSTGDPKTYSTTANHFITVSNKAVKLFTTPAGYTLADFGKDAFGKLLLHLTPSEKDTLIIHLGEKLTNYGHIDRNPGGTIRYFKISLPVDPGKNDYLLELPQDKRNTGSVAVKLPESFGVLAPFRYCEIENYKLQIKPEDIIQKAYHYFFLDDAAAFECSDTVLNQVWNFCKYSIKATSFTGIYIDGDRERIPYEADAYINQLGHYYTDREYSMARTTNEYFINHPTWPTEWILHTVLMFYNDYMFTGNLESARTYYDELKYKTLSALARNDGLISSSGATDEIMKSLGFANEKERIRDIVDWPPAQKDTGWKLATPEGERDGYDMVKFNTVVNAFYFRNLILMSKLAEDLKKTTDAGQFRADAEKVKKSFNRVFLDKATGIYVDGESSVHSSLHANMLALAFGLVPEENKRKVIDFIKSRGMACSVYGSQYLLEGLYRAGEEDYALSLLSATHDRSWWNMIRSGSTITMEAWDMKYKPNSDWNHAWGAVPANIIPGYMWGIQPVKPGFEKAIIKPQLGNLKHSSITVPTIRGSIIAEFNDTGKRKEFSISIPGNMECDFILSGNNTIRLKPGINKIKYLTTKDTKVNTK
jgi:alpha-L-rhamnosidase